MVNVSLLVVRFVKLLSWWVYIIEFVLLVLLGWDVHLHHLRIITVHLHVILHIVCLLLSLLSVVILGGVIVLIELD